MKNWIFVFLFFFSYLFPEISIGQIASGKYLAHLICEYQYIGKPDTTKLDFVENEVMLLLFTNKFSKFISKNQFIRDSIIYETKINNLEKNKGLLELRKHKKALNKFSVVKDNNKNVYHLENIGGDHLWFNDKNCTLNWTITEDSKNLFGYNCQKASIHFRGRNYIAWFTSDIPINDGPYKFSNLPGLILEIYDIQNQFHFKIIKLFYPKSNYLVYVDPFGLEVDKNQFQKLKSDFEFSPFTFYQKKYPDAKFGVDANEMDIKYRKENRRNNEIEKY